MAHHQEGAEAASVAVTPAVVVAVAVANVSNFPAMGVASSEMAASSSTTRSDLAVAVAAWVAVAAVALAINGPMVETALTVILANSAMAVTQLLEVVLIAVPEVGDRVAKANAINLPNQDLASSVIHADSHIKAKLNSIESYTNF